MKLKKNSKIVILLIFFVFVFTSCLSNNDTTMGEEVTSKKEEISKEDPPAVSGGVLKLAMRNPTTLNPLINNNYSIDQILKLMFEPMIIVEDNQELSSNLLSAWIFNEDASSISLSIKNDFVWHDGSQVSADDFIYSYETILNSEETSIYKKNIEYISSVNKVDSKTVEVYFTKAGYINIYALSFPLISKEHFSNEENSLKPLGNSNYKFDSFETMKKFVLLKNNDEIYIDKIEVTVLSEEGTELYSFTEGLIDIISAKSTDLGKYAFSDNYKFEEFQTRELDFIAFNFTNKYLSQKDFRKMIESLINKDELITSLYLNYGEKVDTPIAKNSIYYDNELINQEYDKSKAEEYLKALGIDKKNAEGFYLDENSNVIELNIILNKENIVRKNIADTLKIELEILGIKTIVEDLDEEDYLNRVEVKDYDMAVTGASLSLMPDYSALFSSASNLTNYKNNEIDIILDSVLVSVNENEFKDNLKKLQRNIKEELPLICLAYKKSLIAKRPYVYGELNSSFEYLYRNMDKIYIITK